MMDRWPFDRPDRPLIGGHRGDSAHWPENSQAAFQGAIAAGADFIETDVRMTADGVLVACHDADFARLRGDDRCLADLTMVEALSLLPTLCRVEDVARQVLPHALLLLDVKLTGAADLIAMATSLAPIAANGRIALGLRSPEAVRVLLAHLPDWPRLGLFANPADYPSLAAMGGTWARLWEADTSAARIADLRALGLNVVIMTGKPTAQSVGVIDPKTLAALLNNSPDAVMLNDPGLAVRSSRQSLFQTQDQES